MYMNYWINTSQVEEMIRSHLYCRRLYGEALWVTKAQRRPASGFDAYAISRATAGLSERNSTGILPWTICSDNISSVQFKHLKWTTSNSEYWKLTDVVQFSFVKAERNWSNSLLRMILFGWLYSGDFKILNKFGYRCLSEQICGWTLKF